MGYRDYGDPSQFEIMDFVEKEGFPHLQTFLDGLVAKGGDDSTEDIAGGLKVMALPCKLMMLSVGMEFWTRSDRIQSCLVLGCPTF